MPPLAKKKDKVQKKEQPPVERKERTIIYPTRDETNTADPALYGKPWTLEEWRALPQLQRIEMRLYLDDGEMTADEAKTLLGWQETTAEDPSKLFYSVIGKWIRCTNNTHNRPFEEQYMRRYCQDILNRNWAGTGDDPDETINCETFIISRDAEIIDGQKRLAGFVEACHIWAGKGGLMKDAGDQSAHWRKLWPQEPRLPCSVSLGCSPSQRVVRTVNDGQPRDAADVFYLDPALLGWCPSKDRKTLSRMLDYATRMLWDRTGAKLDAHNPYRTNSEVVDFVNRHLTLLKCVRHVWDENKAQDGVAISRYLTPGYASALMYLMAVSASDGDKYLKAEHRTEASLDLKSWKKAEAFWTALAGFPKDQTLAAVMMAERPVPGFDRKGAIRPGGHVFGSNCGSQAEKLAVLAKAWALFAEGKPVKHDDVKLAYKNHEWIDDSDNGKPMILDSCELDEASNFGGIDLGGVSQDDEDAPDAPTPEEIKAANIKKLQMAGESPIPKPPTKKPTLSDVADELVKNGKVPAEPAKEKSKLGPKPKQKDHDGGKKPVGNRGPR